jgi:hypothetical protein
LAEKVLSGAPIDDPRGWNLSNLSREDFRGSGEAEKVESGKGVEKEVTHMGLLPAQQSQCNSNSGSKRCSSCSSNQSCGCNPEVRLDDSESIHKMSRPRGLLRDDSAESVGAEAEESFRFL